MTIKDKATAFQLSFCCAVLDRVRGREKPKSARWNAVNNMEERFQKVLDMYRAEAWSVNDLDNASALFDLMENKIEEMYPVKP